MILSTAGRSILVTLSTFTTMLTNAQYVGPDLVPRQSLSLGPGPVSLNPSATTSSSSSASSPTASLTLQKPDQMTTCQSGSITWFYSGPSPAQLTLELTDVDVDQSTTSTPPTIILTLADGIDATAGNWTWQQVDVPSGRYIVEGAVLDANATSNPFFIANGSDTSCLQTITTTTATPSQTATSKTSHVAAIAGGAVGGVVLLAAILGALLLWRKSRQTRSRRGAAVGRWGGLGSNASGEPFTRDKEANGNHHGPSESMGGMLNDVGPAGNTVTASSRDDFDSVEEEEKLSSPISPAQRPDSIVVLPYSAAHRRGSSALERHSDIPLPAIDPRADNRRRLSLDLTDYRHSPGSSPSTKSSSRKPSAEMIPMDRSTSGNRRSSRKPVPQYDAAEIQSNVGMPSSEQLATDFNSSYPPPNGNPKHKLSSGDIRPIHYLIPDMPTPNK